MTPKLYQLHDLQILAIPNQSPILLEKKSHHAVNIDQDPHQLLHNQDPSEKQFELDDDYCYDPEDDEGQKYQPRFNREQIDWIRQSLLHANQFPKFILELNQDPNESHLATLTRLNDLAFTRIQPDEKQSLFAFSHSKRQIPDKSLREQFLQQAIPIANSIRPKLIQSNELLQQHSKLIENLHKSTQRFKPNK